MKPILKFLSAWMFLNLLLTLDYPIPEPGGSTLLSISPEVLGLMAMIWLAARIGIPLRPVVAAATLTVVFLRLFRSADVLVPTYFNRPFSLFIDVCYIDDLAGLLSATLPPAVFGGYALIAATAAGLLTVGTWIALKTIYARFARGRAHVLFPLLLLIAAGVSAMGAIQWRPGFLSPPLLPRVTAELKFIVHTRQLRQTHLSALEDRKQRMRAGAPGLARLRGADVHLFFIESYGHTLFENQTHLAMFEPVLGELADVLEAKGFSTLSGFLRSPTYGGASWLAHATVASGVHLNDQLAYNLLITSDLKPLAGYFNAAGYRTVSVMPNTTHPWPEGRYFEFQQTYCAWNFDYTGPTFGWATMPDQYVLDFIRRREIDSRRQPLFIEYALVSSHAPFNAQPPYFPDGTQLADGALFHTRPAVTFPIVWPELQNAAEGYVHAIAYDLRVIRDYICRHLRDNSLILIAGDHQPNIRITGDGRPWSVPVHAISQTPQLLEPFRRMGYTPGLIPHQAPPHPGLETLFFGLLTDLSRQSPAETAVSCP